MTYKNKLVPLGFPKLQKIRDIKEITAETYVVVDEDIVAYVGPLTSNTNSNG